jgi:aspartyl protease family protein
MPKLRTIFFVTLIALFTYALLGYVPVGNKANFLYSTTLLILIASSVIFRGKIKTNLKYLAIWGGIFLTLLIGYTLRSDVTTLANKLVAELIPSRAITTSDAKALSFRMADDGHFHINSQINGNLVRFMVDTGASDIVLSPQDAIRLGFDLKTLQYNKFYNTANGTVSGAAIRLESFRISDHIIYDVKASVNSAKMDSSLLGMSFLNQLESYKVENNVLTIIVR